MLDVLVTVDLLLPVAGEVLEEGVLVEQHHQLEKLVLLHLHGDLLERVVGIEVGLLQVLPLEVLLEGEIVLQPECAIRVLPLQAVLEVEHQEETSIDVVLSMGGLVLRST